jgi:hypothetical protein
MYVCVWVCGSVCVCECVCVVLQMRFEKPHHERLTFGPATTLDGLSHQSSPPQGIDWEIIKEVISIAGSSCIQVAHSGLQWFLAVISNYLYTIWYLGDFFPGLRFIIDLYGSMVSIIYHKSSS